jgi:hypothetical protein
VGLAVVAEGDGELAWEEEVEGDGEGDGEVVDVADADGDVVDADGAGDVVDADGDGQFTVCAGLPLPIPLLPLHS